MVSARKRFVLIHVKAHGII